MDLVRSVSNRGVAKSIKHEMTATVAKQTRVVLGSE